MKRLGWRMSLFTVRRRSVWKWGSPPAGNRRNKSPADFNPAVDASAYQMSLHCTFIIRFPTWLESRPKSTYYQNGEPDYIALKSTEQHKMSTALYFKVRYFGSVKPAANTRARQYCSKLHSVVLVRPRTSFHSAAAGRQKGETASLEIWQADALIRFTAPTTFTAPPCTTSPYTALYSREILWRIS